MDNLVRFLGGSQGAWRVASQSTYRGQGLPDVPGIDVAMGAGVDPPGTLWRLAGVISNIRYSTRGELDTLRAMQEGLGRPAALCAAMLPIRKTAAWWELAQDERRAIFEETSHHTAIGLEYLPGIARRLHHCRDLGGEFDFVTWFEFAPAQTSAFDEMLTRLRATREWDFVEREVDIRLVRSIEQAM